MTVTIRQLQPDEWRILRDVRLRALRTDPTVFGANYAVETEKTESQWRDWLAHPHPAIFVLFDGDNPIGMTGVTLDWDDPTGRTAYLWGSWLAPEYRGKGLSKLIYQARLDWAKARTEISSVVVSHRASNLSSKFANQAFGFRHTHSLPKTWQDGVTEDDMRYRLFIRPPWGVFPIETDRLILRPVRPEDAELMVAHKRETLDQLKLWMPWAQNEPNVDADREMLKAQVAEHANGEDCMLIGEDKATGKAVIYTGLHRPDWQNRVFEIGYWVPLSAQGNGYATEAANALVKHGLNYLKGSKMTIAAAVGNDASEAVIRKCGFEFTHEVEKDPSNPDKGMTRWFALTPASA